MPFDTEIVLFTNASIDLYAEGQWFLPKSDRPSLLKAEKSIVLRNSLAAHITVQKKLMTTYGLAEPQQLAHTSKGKPYFANFPDFHFSITHTQQQIAIAFASYPIGVDLERIRPCNLQIAQRFFHSKESEILLSLPENQRNECFTRIWVLKEAYVKCIGTGIANTFSNFQIVLQNDKYYINEVGNPMKLTLSTCPKNMLLGVCENPFKQ